MIDPRNKPELVDFIKSIETNLDIVSYSMFNLMVDYYKKFQTLKPLEYQEISNKILIKLEIRPIEKSSSCISIIMNEWPFQIRIKLHDGRLKLVFYKTVMFNSIPDIIYVFDKMSNTLRCHQLPKHYQTDLSGRPQIHYDEELLNMLESLFGLSYIRSLNFWTIHRDWQMRYLVWENDI